ncbi:MULTISPECIES: Lrp/AsnC family transcriptional regulator [Dehalobacter]|jgi:DNA-binding Lrp family transcriptional regulator|uniref:AsnC family transcriptional regulator n=2 Tax=Dehalobacter restrictus TaxID=55583 RepID=A0A857DJD6_9FIRM|nr:MULTISPECIES: Lrp/AsnC family transcriptional regulator [Dehalobacter]AHF10229.1 AsnC family transcriptional regulator [Dehalobacter restrictus DSM 9455]MCG1025651.1 Lrp/AsnC family transcriptional regulator [Dehalobacter sp.]MDJ0306260.1 Lrp/AsnC family transcriptional regulator [Dehalobacter sp.]OCZ51461.1 AsnC family transcriptional regulator [Dehalobacter sp. TeCB1]QHA00821.1 AsnC family transcriptional regulator [Dehalobacter restrictus]
MLSEDDRRLLHILSQDCRLTAEDLAVQTGLTADYIKKKIKQWEDDKVIAKYGVLINYDQLEEDRVTALIDVKVLPQRGNGYDKIAQRFQKFSEIKSVYLMSGDFDLCLIIEGHNMHEIAQFVSDKLSPLDVIQSTSTRFILRRYKQDGIEFHGEEERPQRLMITP